MNYKGHIERLPVIKFPREFEVTDKVLSVSIPLFYSDYDRPFQSVEFDNTLFRNVHCRGAVWAAMAILYNTDLGEKGVGVYFHVEDVIWDQAMAVFSEFDVPESMIRKISVPVGEYEDDFLYTGKDPCLGKKYLCLLDEELDPEIYMILDSDSFFCSGGGVYPLYDKLTMPIMHRFVSTTHASIFGMPYEGALRSTCNAVGFSYDPEVSMYEQDMAAHKRIGMESVVREIEDKDESVAHYSCLSNMVTIPKNSVLVDRIKSVIGNCFDDESLLSTHGEDEQILQLKDVLQIEQYNKEFFYLQGIEGPASARQFKIHTKTNAFLISGENTALPENYIVHFRKTDHLDQYMSIFLDDLSRHVLPKGGLKSVWNPTWVDFNSALRGTGSTKDTDHGYGRIYNWIINELSFRQGRNLRVLEIGVSMFGQGSLKAFQSLDIFEEIVAVDIEQYSGRLSRRTMFYQGNAYRQGMVTAIESRHKPFDLIIDDGSHFTQDQLFFLTNYEKLVAPGGMLICEDVGDMVFFRKMCHELGFFGLDLWANKELHPESIHLSRMLIKQM